MLEQTRRRFQSVIPIANWLHTFICMINANECMTCLNVEWHVVFLGNLANTSHFSTLKCTTECFVILDNVAPHLLSITLGYMLAFSC